MLQWIGDNNYMSRVEKASDIKYYKIVETEGEETSDDDKYEENVWNAIIDIWE